jgi:hypothetical protein
MQETITTINDKSITTYQNGSKVTADNEYSKADANATTKTDRIYFTVEGAEGGQSLLSLVKNTNVWLYTAWADDPSIITEEAVANYKANNIVLTDVTSQLDLTETEAPNKSGAQYSIKFTAGTVASFEPVAKYYVIKAEYEDGANTYITYKVIKVKDGSYAKNYAITAPTAISNLGSAIFTISNTPKEGTDQTAAELLMTGNVTGASGAFKVTNSATENVTDRFTIEEGPIVDDSDPASPVVLLAANTYRITSKGVPAGNYTITMGGATASITVNAPVWYQSNGSTTLSTTNVEAGNSIDVIIKDAADGMAMEDVVPAITPATGAKGKLTASVSTSTGKITLTASKDAYGAFTVAHNGASFTVYVDKYSITADRYIINVGDTEHNTAKLTLANAYTGTGASSVTGKTLTSGTPAVAAKLELGGSSNNGDITALKAGTTTYSYGNATCDIEVVDYVLSQAATRDGDLTVQLKQKKAGESTYSAVKNVTTIVAEDCTIEATTTDGVYKVKGATSGKVVQFKYKNQVVADVPLGDDPGADPAMNP